MQPHSPGETLHQSPPPSRKAAPTDWKADQFKVARETTNETLQILSSLQPNQFKLYNDALEMLNNQMLSDIPGNHVLSSLSQLENREQTTTSTSDTAVTTLPQETLDMQITQAEMPQQNEEDNYTEVPLVQLQPGPLQTVLLGDLEEDSEYTLFTLQPVPVYSNESPPEDATLDDLQFAPGVKSKGRPSKRKGVPSQKTAQKKRLL